MCIRDRVGGVLLDENNLVILHISVAERLLFGTLLRVAVTVPEQIDVAAVKLHLLGAPLDRLELELYTQAAEDLRGNIHVKADEMCIRDRLKAAP